MKPLFTIHAGEYLAGSYIEKTFKKCRVWLPSKDTGVDLLVTNQRADQAIRLQVKSSKDFAHSHMSDYYKGKVAASSWFTLQRKKIESSEADYWLFVISPFAKYAPSFLMMSTANLLRRVTAIHGIKAKYDIYFTLTERQTCWETRGLKELERREIIDSQDLRHLRNFSQELNDWSVIKNLNR